MNDDWGHGSGWAENNETVQVINIIGLDRLELRRLQKHKVWSFEDYFVNLFNIVFTVSGIEGFFSVKSWFGTYRRQHT